MTTKLNYIIEQIADLNPLHGKRLKKNAKIADEAYHLRAQAFLTRYEELLKEGNKTIDYAIDCYLQMIADVNYESVEFSHTGEYSSKSFAEVNKRVYGNSQVMEYYMHGLLLSQFLWPHHYDILLHFNALISTYKSGIKRYLEVGGGHGLYISEALSIIGDQATFQMVDISESSLDIAKKMVANDKVNYLLSDVFEYFPPVKFDFITMGEVLEHVEDPVKLLQKLHSLVADDGRVFVTTPTNAPAIDHIYLFRNADEIRTVIKKAGFKICEERCIWSENLPEEVMERMKISMMYVGLLMKQ
ncbi:MAG: class I SAM-dependent methyltransferase [Limisphaerales bacterium]